MSVWDANTRWWFHYWYASGEAMVYIGGSTAVPRRETGQEGDREDTDIHAVAGLAVHGWVGRCTGGTRTRNCGWMSDGAYSRPWVVRTGRQVDCGGERA